MAEEIKVPGETPKTKAELFASDPDRFIDAQEVLFVIGRNPEGKLMIMNRCMTMADCKDVRFEADMSTLERIGLIRAEAAKQKSSIVKPNAFMNGIRAMKNGRH